MNHFGWPWTTRLVMNFFGWPWTRCTMVCHEPLWLIMNYQVSHELLWSTMDYHGLSWTTLFDHELPKLIMNHFGWPRTTKVGQEPLWLTMNYQGWSWTTLVDHELPRLVMSHFGWPWITKVSHELHWLTIDYQGQSWARIFHIILAAMHCLRSLLHVYNKHVLVSVYKTTGCIYASSQFIPVQTIDAPGWLIICM